MNYYALGGAKRTSVDAPKLPAEEIAEIVEQHGSASEKRVGELTLAPVIDISSHSSFDSSWLDQIVTLRPLEPQAGLGGDRAIRA